MDATTIETILAPISPQAPAGLDLRRESGDQTMDRIEEMRREEDAKTALSGEAKSPEWKSLIRECEETLAKRTKDLDIVRFLTEGLVHVEGFAGLGIGLMLTRELLVRFWDGLHPGEEGGNIDPELRARPISWLGSSSAFIRDVKQIPWAVANGGPILSWFEYEAALRRNSIEAWRKSTQAAPVDSLRAILRDIETSREEFGKLEAVCREKFGARMPELRDLGDLLDQCLDQLKSQLPDGKKQPAPGEPNPVSIQDPRAESSSGPVTSREEAFSRLREAADYLRRTEPQSPVFHLIDRAIRWGNMSFEDWFRDVVKSKEVQSQVWDALGLQKPDKPA